MIKLRKKVSSEPKSLQLNDFIIDLFLETIVIQIPYDF